jgi:hypothetical protein
VYPILAAPPSPPLSLEDLLRPQWAARVNAQVAARFDGFARRLVLTPLQQKDAVTKVAGIVKCLNNEYWGLDSDSAHCIIEGSWGKGTQGRPPRDVDVIFVLPYQTYEQFQNRGGNRQSQLLQDIKHTLSSKYPATHMRGDGQVVVVNFASGHGVEVVPAFKLENGQYWICNTYNGGSYKQVDPLAEIAAIQRSDAATAGTTRNLIRMIKRWQRFYNIGDLLKSFQIELLVIDFLPTVSYSIAAGGLHDWLIRDFFGYLVQRKGSYVVVPGTSEIVWLGEAWMSRAQSAYARAVNASAYEERELLTLAVDEWQKIFGTDIT